MKDQREAFEAWLIEFKPNAMLIRCDGKYISGTTESYFKCWQAAIESQNHFAGFGKMVDQS